MVNVYQTNGLAANQTRKSDRKSRIKIAQNAIAELAAVESSILFREQLRIIRMADEKERELAARTLHNKLLEHEKKFRFVYKPQKHE